MPEVVSHNMETVRRLTREVRIQAKYDPEFGCIKIPQTSWCASYQIRNHAWAGRD